MAKALAIGLGKSGVAAAKLLHRQGWDVVASDRGTSEALQQKKIQLEREGIAVRLGASFDPTAEPWDLIAVSPGVPWDLPDLARARAMGIETIGEMELAWRSLQNCPWVGITGTNGKTTTTALANAIFETAGYRAPACGNIGYAACELALAALDRPIDWAIAELSSYQIEASNTIAPEIGIWTTFTPDHLSRHKTLENYYHIKARLLKRSRQQIFNGDDGYLRKHHADWPDAIWTSVRGKERLPDGCAGKAFSQKNRGIFIEEGWVTWGDEKIVRGDALSMRGSHNQQNLLLAVGAALLAGIDKEAIAQAVAEFPGVPHRLERVGIWAGVEFINDSKATNYDAAEVGLAAVEAPALLIAGGEAKEGDDTAWLRTVRQKAAAVLLVGRDADRLASRLSETGYKNYEIVGTMENAVARSLDLAKQHRARVVLLSPACASFDSYANFEQRGDRFRLLCQQTYGDPRSSNLSVEKSLRL